MQTTNKKSITERQSLFSIAMLDSTAKPQQLDLQLD